ncbi:spore coat U domain-containing protein [Paenochrobactrum glaciei]|uniref:Spore coat U domain-containing protein n=1 Tax=Paenochrobactrum glaciei TaxID=486407 RepID=A0ABP3RPT7_9HYPH
MKLKKLIFFTTLIIPTFSSALIAHAGQANGTLQVKARITGGCTLTNTSDAILDFGVVEEVTDLTEIVKSDDDVSIQIQCSNGIDYSIGLGGGLNPVGGTDTPLMRAMTFENEKLPYLLWTSPTMEVEWNLRDRVYGTGNGNIQKYPVYGNLYPNGILKPGDYTDTVTIEVKY